MSDDLFKEQQDHQKMVSWMLYHNWSSSTGDDPADILEREEDALNDLELDSTLGDINMAKKTNNAKSGTYATIFALHDRTLNLDKWTKLSIYGSWAYIINSQCINMAMRYVPETPENLDGLDEFSAYDNARSELIRTAETSPLPDMIMLQRDVQDWILEAEGQAGGLESTLRFMNEQMVPDRARIENQYQQMARIRKPRISMDVFVEHEYRQAMVQHNDRIARGEDAVRLCETVTFDRKSEPLPEWLAEAFESKLLDKLHSRWERLEMDLMRPNMAHSRRKSIMADIQLIESVLESFGEKPTFYEDAPADDDDFDDIEALASVGN